MVKEIRTSIRNFDVKFSSLFQYTFLELETNFALRERIERHYSRCKFNFRFTKFPPDCPPNLSLRPLGKIPSSFIVTRLCPIVATYVRTFLGQFHASVQSRREFSEYRNSGDSSLARKRENEMSRQVGVPNASVPSNGIPRWSNNFQ